MHGHVSTGPQYGCVELKQSTDRVEVEQHISSSSNTSCTIMLSDEEMARRLHEELNYGPKVARTRRSDKLPPPEPSRTAGEGRGKQVC